MKSRLKQQILKEMYQKLIKIIFDLGVTAKITPEDIVNSKTMSYVKNQVLITFKYVTVVEINEVISSINGELLAT